MEKLLLVAEKLQKVGLMEINETIRFTTSNDVECPKNLCMMKVPRFRKKLKKYVYPDIPSARKTVPRRNGVLPPVPCNSNEIV